MKMPSMNEMIMQAAINKIKSSKNLPNEPWVGPAVDAIMKGDAKAGEEIANNLCKSYNTPKEEAINKSKSFLSGFLGLPF